MIYEEDLREAIAECEGERNPKANTCLRLMAYYFLLDRYTGDSNDQSGELLPSPVERGREETIIGRHGDDELSSLVAGKRAADVWPVLSELLITIEIINKPLHDSVVRQLSALE